jgi:hypothetical protein
MLDGPLEQEEHSRAVALSARSMGEMKCMSFSDLVLTHETGSPALMLQA